VNTLIRSVAGVFFGVLLFIGTAQATDYYWSWAGTGSYGSASAACNAGGAGTYAGNPNQAFSSATVTGISGAVAYCQYYYTWTPASGADDTTTPHAGAGDQVNRGGNGCPSGSTYNNATGSCDFPDLQPGEECADQTGATAGNPKIWDSTVNACVLFSESEGKAPCSYLANKGGTSSYLISGAVSSGYVFAPPTFATQGTDCEIQTVRTTKCVVKVNGEGKCVVDGVYSGEVFGGGTDINDALCPDGVCPENQAETTTDNQPCEPVSNGSGGTTCTQTTKTEAEGEQSCGTFNGALTCTSKSPASNGLTTNITATTATQPNGDVQVTTVKDSTLTVCKDVNTCTSTHSTTTSVSTTKPSGATSTTNTCQGSCTSNGGGVETVPGAGTSAGTGTGTCVGEDCGQGGDGSASSVQSCEETPPCEGDPFQCAMLIQAHYDTCKLMAEPTAEQQAESDTRVNDAWDQYDANQATMDGQATSLLGQFQGSIAGGGGGGVCLQDVPFTVQGHTIVLEFSRVCDSIAFIRLGILVVAYLIAARIVLRGTED